MPCDVTPAKVVIRRGKVGGRPWNNLGGNVIWQVDPESPGSDGASPYLPIFDRPTLVVFRFTLADPEVGHVRLKVERPNAFFPDTDTSTTPHYGQAWLRRYHHHTGCRLP
jgi:hypothetical protein